MRKPMLSGDLVEAATMLLIAEDCGLIEVTTTQSGETGYECEPALADARVAASAYLVACFAYAQSAFEGDDGD